MHNSTTQHQHTVVCVRRRNCLWPRNSCLGRDPEKPKTLFQNRHTHTHTHTQIKIQMTSIHRYRYRSPMCFVCILIILLTFNVVTIIHFTNMKVRKMHNKCNSYSLWLCCLSNRAEAIRLGLSSASTAYVSRPKSKAETINLNTTKWNLRLTNQP